MLIHEQFNESEKEIEVQLERDISQRAWYVSRELCHLS